MLVHSAKTHGHIPNVDDVARRDMLFPILYIECLTHKKKEQKHPGICSFMASQKSHTVSMRDLPTCLHQFWMVKIRAQLAYRKKQKTCQHRLHIHCQPEKYQRTGHASKKDPWNNTALSCGRRYGHMD